MKDLALGLLVGLLGFGGGGLGGLEGCNLDGVLPGGSGGHSHDVTVNLGDISFTGGTVSVDGTSSGTGTGTGSGSGGSAATSDDHSTVMETTITNECPGSYDRCR